MRRHLFVSTSVMFLLALLLAFPGLSPAAEEQPEGVQLKEGMSQGNFAFWLIKAIQPQLQGLTSGQVGIAPSVNFLLNPAAGPEEAIKFLTDQLGLIPEGGWKKDEPLTKEALASLLEKPEEGANLSFDELVAKVLKRVQERFQEINKKQGVFRIFSSTPSQPAA